jgi:hypothetical protein
MSFRDGTTATGGNEEKDETYKRIIGKKNVPDLDKGELMFRLVSSKPEDFKHCMKFWLRVGRKQNEDKFFVLPRVSPNPFTDFIVSDGRGGTRLGRTAAAAKGCVLSKLAENNHPLIDLSPFKDSQGRPKRNIEPVHVARVQVIERKRDANGRPMNNPDGTPALNVQGEEMLMEFPQSWWDQFVNVVDPIPQEQAASDLREVKEPKKLPTADLTRVVWMVYKEKRTKNPTGDPKKDVDYIVDFASKTILPANLPTPEHVDFDAAYKVITQEEVDEWVKRAEDGWPARSDSAAPAESAGGAGGHGDEDDPAAYGQRVGDKAPEGAPAPAPTGSRRDF